MSVPRTFNGSCPADAGTINVHQSVFQVGGGEGIVSVYTDEDFSGVLLTLPHTPLQGYSIMVFVNGLLQTVPEDYTIAGDNITFSNILTGDAVQVRYATASAALSSAATVLRYSAVVTGTVVNLNYTPGSLFPVTVYVNGVLQVSGTHYTVVGGTITFASALSGDNVQILYAA